MGCGTSSLSSYAEYSNSRGIAFDTTTGRRVKQTFYSKKLDDSLNPKKFSIRECCNSEEHPNTIPVILALDVTGSMGEACNETAKALGTIVINLYKKFKDIEFCIMGIGDLAYDNAPIQMSQFESDVRIAEALDKLFIEKGGGGNAYESYTAAWYMGLHHTKLDCYDKQGRRGIIITMGDEMLNPYLPKRGIEIFTTSHVQDNVETKDLYNEVTKKFDVFHIAVDDKETLYEYHRKSIEDSFGKLLRSHYKVATIQDLAKTIEDCITEAVEGISIMPSSVTEVDTNGCITW